MEESKQPSNNALPSSWQIKTLGDITSRIGSGITPSGGNEVYKDEGVIFIRSQNVTNSGLNLTRGLNENGELRDPIRHPEQFKDSPLGKFPAEWNVATLGKFAEVSSGVTLGNNLQGSGTIKLPYLRVANVQDGYLDLSEVKKIRILKKDIDRFSLQKGDVLMNEGGDYDKLGRGAVWEGQIEPCLHQNHVFRVRPILDILDSYFLDAVSGSEYGKRYFLLSPIWHRSIQPNSINFLFPVRQWWNRKR